MSRTLSRTFSQTRTIFAGAVAAVEIDHSHLNQMTFGDAALAREVLGLFDRQAAFMLERLPLADAKALAALAHALKGSARGIGAWRVAQAAADVEGGDQSALAALSAALIAARAEIANIPQHA